MLYLRGKILHLPVLQLRNDCIIGWLVGFETRAKGGWHLQEGTIGPSDE